MKKDTQKKSKFVTARISDDLAERLMRAIIREQIEKNRLITLSTVITDCLIDYIERSERTPENNQL